MREKVAKMTENAWKCFLNLLITFLVSLFPLLMDVRHNGPRPKFGSTHDTFWCPALLIIAPCVGNTRWHFTHSVPVCTHSLGKISSSSWLCCQSCVTHLWKTVYHHPMFYGVRWYGCPPPSETCPTPPLKRTSYLGSDSCWVTPHEVAPRPGRIILKFVAAVENFTVFTEFTGRSSNALHLWVSI